LRKHQILHVTDFLAKVDIVPVILTLLFIFGNRSVKGFYIKNNSSKGVGHLLLTGLIAINGHFSQKQGLVKSQKAIA
jgi:hypothetical protein